MSEDCHESGIKLPRPSGDELVNERLQQFKREVPPIVPISIHEITVYEVHASWWAKYCGPRLERFSAYWHAWKVRRKYGRYRRSVDERRKLLMLPPV